MSRKKSKKQNLRSQEVQEILTSPPSWIIRWGITIVFLITILLIFLSFFIKYPDFISAKVLITTKSPMERVRAKQPGQLAKIFIRNGDTIEKNQKLAVLKNTANHKDLEKLKNELNSFDFEKNPLNFPISKLKSLQLGEVKPAFLKFETSLSNYYILKNFASYSSKIQGNTESLSQTKRQLRDQIEQRELLQKEFELAETNYYRYESLFNKGVISEQDFEAKELEFIQMQKNIKDMEISISRLKSTLSSTNQAIRDNNIGQKEDELRYRTELAQSYSSLLKAIEDWEYNYILRSSIAGVVSFQNVWGENQYVQNDEVIFSVLPIHSPLIGKLSISSLNSGKVSKGQKVLIKLDNFPYQQYGMLVGKVKNISIATNSDNSYTLFISLPQRTRSTYGKKLDFNQELLGNAEIITNDLSIAQRIFHRFNSLFNY